MKRLTRAVTTQLRSLSGGRRLRVGIFCRGNLRLAESIITEGHRTILVSDRFSYLYRVHKRITNRSLLPFAAIEAEFENLPIPPHSLNAFILTKGLPSSIPPEESLRLMRGLLAPRGQLLWPHPIIDGFMGHLGAALVPVRQGVTPPARRHRLCSWTMAAGFSRVEQMPRIFAGPVPWVVTAGTAGRTLP